MVEQVGSETPPVVLAVQELSIQYRVFLREPVEDSRVLVAPRTKATVDALTSVDFTLREGDALGLVGHNGSGKSTLINAIAGVLAPSKGRVLVRTQPMSLGTGSLIRPKMTGRQNIHVGLLSLGHTAAEIPALGAEIIKFLELGEFIDAPASTYSAGMRARLKFAIATQRRPDILLLDEALGFGDRRFKKRGLARVEEIRDNAGAIIMASHQPEEIIRTCNVALWLKGGEMAAFGDPEEVIESYEADDGAKRNTVRRGVSKRFGFGPVRGRSVSAEELGQAESAEQPPETPKPNTSR